MPVSTDRSTRRRSTPIRGAALAACALLATTSTPAIADWRRDYELGLRAVEQGDWAEAERRMRAALAEDAEPNARKRFQGVKFDRYVPHWYAGLAAFRQGDCARANEYWNHAATRQVVAGIPELVAEQRRHAAECTTRLAAQPTPAGQDAAKPAARPPATSTASPTAASGETGSPPRGVARTADAARADTGRTATEPARTQPRDTTPAVATAPERPSASAPPPRTTTPPRAEAAAAPAALRKALDAWLSGRYRDIAAIDPASVTDNRARTQLHLLRAAARFVESELAGGDDTALRTAADEVRAARRLGTVAPDHSLFPPRFRAFVTATR